MMFKGASEKQPAKHVTSLIIITTCRCKLLATARLYLELYIYV